MVSSLPFAACIGASVAFTGTPIADPLTVEFVTGLATGFCVTVGDTAALLDF
jgi:hypothetical protein